MCGIVGVISKTPFSSEELISKLRKLEYRGYDSAGIAMMNGNMHIEKAVGKISELEKKFKPISGTIGIAHTRWATTGAVTHQNAHPHTNCNKTVAVVHNGIIENYAQLKSELLKTGHKFISETDSEVLAHLLEDMPPETVLSSIRGRNTFLAMYPDKMVAVKNGSPLAIGIAKNCYYAASDALPFLDETRDVIFLEDGDIAEISKNEVKFHGVQRKPEHIEWNIGKVQKGAYPHFLIKEIMEQPITIEMAAAQDDDKILQIANLINNSFGSFFIACGTASYAALAASYFFSGIAKKHINFSVGSEFPSHKHFLADKSLVIAISQSGETADTLEAMKAAKEKNAKTVALVNVPGSTMMRQADHWLLTNAGPEVAVCSTKAFTSQLSVSLLLAYAAAGKLNEGKQLLKETSLKAKNMLTDACLKEIKSLAKKIANKEHIYIIGKGFNYPIALEAALKIKEVSYIHAEGFASGELKHGVIALIEKGTPCIAIISNDEVKQDVLNGASEIKLRGGYIIGISPENSDLFDCWIPVPDAGNASPLINVLPVQLLTYYLALERGCDPDFCRNLAKSVTVK
jgi:glucosamine--fructose-6-phosphate aminotransferase (isomerizing)